MATSKDVAQGPWWTPTAEVERMMRECQSSLSDTWTLDIKVLEGLLHDSLLWRQDRLRQPVETTAPQAPIATLMVAEGFVTWTHLKAPGLPNGMHDLYCEPEAVAPYMRRKDEPTWLDDYVLPVAQRESAGAPEVAGSNPAGQGSSEVKRLRDVLWHIRPLLPSTGVQAVDDVLRGSPVEPAEEQTVWRPVTRQHTVYECPCKGHPFDCYGHPTKCGCSGAKATGLLIVSAEEAKQPLAFRHWSKDSMVPVEGCHCGTCVEARGSENGTRDV